MAPHDLKPSLTPRARIRVPPALGNAISGPGGSKVPLSAYDESKSDPYVPSPAMRTAVSAPCKSKCFSSRSPDSFSDSRAARKNLQFATPEGSKSTFGPSLTPRVRIQNSAVAGPSSSRDYSSRSLNSARKELQYSINETISKALDEETREKYRCKQIKKASAQEPKSSSSDEEDPKSDPRSLVLTEAVEEDELIPSMLLKKELPGADLSEYDNDFTATYETKIKFVRDALLNTKLNNKEAAYQLLIIAGVQEVVNAWMEVIASGEVETDRSVLIAQHFKVECHALCTPGLSLSFEEALGVAIRTNGWTLRESNQLGFLWLNYSSVVSLRLHQSY